MRRDTSTSIGLAGLMALALSCTHQPADPLSPTGGSGGTNASTETLKVGAPTPISPVNDQQPTLLTLTASAAPQKFVAPVRCSTTSRFTTARTCEW